MSRRGRQATSATAPRTRSSTTSAPPSREEQQRDNLTVAGGGNGDDAGASPARLSGVGATALGVAWARAAESRRPDRLFDDPLATAVMERGQRELAESFGVDEHSRAARSLPEEQATNAFLDYAAVRTRYFDDCLIEACAAGCRQVVLLAAGMDARGFRLPWPAGTRVYEVDRPDVLAFKQDVLAAEGIQPRCDRLVVAADLAADWPVALRAAGFDPDQRTAWLAEGLLSYLTTQDNDTLIRAVGSLSGPGSTVALEVIHASAISHGPMAVIADRMASFGAPWRSGIDDPAGWLVRHGWRARVDNPVDVAIRYDRRLTGWPGAGPDDQPTGSLVTATRGCQPERPRS